MLRADFVQIQNISVPTDISETISIHQRQAYTLILIFKNIFRS